MATAPERNAAASPAVMPQAPAGSMEDPVLASLRYAEEEYRKQRLRCDRENEELWNKLSASQAELERADDTVARLTQELAQVRAQAQAEQQKALRQQDRANQLSGALKEIHRALFRGNVYDLILQACLNITGATRGLYITAPRGSEASLRVRAAVDVDGYPVSPPSEFIQALCRRVLQENDTLVCNEPADRSGLPQPQRPGEQFESWIAAPVVLLKHFSGIIIAADKPHGHFNKEDVDSLLSVGDQASVAVENTHLHNELQRAYLATVSMLADAVEAKDAYTGGHCDTVSRYARLTAERLGLSTFDLSVVTYAALLHDVGKIAVSDGVLNKPGPLLPEERELVRSHVRVGHDLIRHIPALEEVAEVVLHHHEWYDGSGYPDGLKGESIPIAARIVCVADAYCAMITRRSYKEAYSSDHAREQLIQCAGTQFDPAVVEAFLEMLQTPEAREHHPESADERLVLPPLHQLRGTTAGSGARAN
jgi:putative nucleotidyltransferase with HDIG domain